MKMARIRKHICHTVRWQLKASSVFYSTSMEYKEKRIKIGKYNINYIKVGNGPHNVLCMSGALGSIWTDFKPQVGGFDREKFSLIAWDLPGYGKSRPPEREFQLDYFAQDMDTALEFMKALDIAKFSLLGWSYGGAASMILAAKYPEVVQKLVLWGTCSYLLPREVQMYKNIKDIRTWSDKMRKPMVEMYGEEGLAKLWAAVVDAMVNAYNDSYINVTNICALLKNVTCPTLILHGEKDPLVENSHASYLHNNIPGSRIHIYPEGRHDIHIQYAQDFNQRVQEFLLES